MTLTRINSNSITDGSVNTADLSFNGGPLSGFRNLIINGNPLVNQRGYVSGTATSGANEYTLDRWRVVTSGQNLTFSTTANVCTATAPAGGVEQVVEGASILGGTYVLNWDGTATATVNGNAVAKGGTVTLTGGTNATVKLTGGTFTKVQLEPGSVATPFEERPAGVELMLCQRYFESVAYPAFYLPATTATAMYIPVYFKANKRATPTVTLPSSTNAAYNDSGSNVTPSIWTVVSVSANAVSIYAGNSSLGGVQSGTLTVSAEL
jgi:hypothetical protein